MRRVETRRPADDQEAETVMRCQRDVGPPLPNVARSMLKSAILSLERAGLITGRDCEHLIALLGLRDA